MENVQREQTTEEYDEKVEFNGAVEEDVESIEVDKDEEPLTREELEKALEELRAFKKNKRITEKVVYTTLGIAVGVAGVLSYLKFSPADKRTNMATDMYLSTLNKKKEDVTRDDVAFTSGLFTAKAEFRTGLISNEEYAEKFDDLAKFVGKGE